MIKNTQVLLAVLDIFTSDILQEVHLAYLSKVIFLACLPRSDHRFKILGLHRPETCSNQTSPKTKKKILSLWSRVARQEYNQEWLQRTI